jgi:hypothetical protein
MTTMAGTNETETTTPKTESADQVKRQRMRSVAIAIGLGVLAIMFYAATIVRLGGNVLNKGI